MESNSTSLQRLAEVRALAIETFGSKAIADAWLNRENLALSATPMSMAESESGLMEVKKILSAIYYGGVV